MPTTTEYAQLANSVYFRTPENRTPTAVGWIELQWIRDIEWTGFSAGVYRKSNDIVISYTGTNEAKVADTVFGNLPVFLGTIPSAQVLAAMKLYLAVKRDNPGANITFTGHSLGGGLASMMAVFFDRPAVVFDPAPFQLGALAPVPLAYYRVGLAVAGFADAAFNTYTPINFFSRESNVAGFWLEGEFLNLLRTEATSIGSYIRVPAAGQTAAADALHSMTALASMLTSTAFAAAVGKAPELLKLMLDGGAYYRDPASSQERNLVDKLYIAQVKDPSVPLLDLFAADIEKLVASPQGVTAQSDVRSGLISAAMEYYYFKEPAAASSLFSTAGNGVHFRFSHSGETDGKARARLVGAVNALLSYDELRALGAITDPAQINILSGTGRLLGQDAWHIQAGAEGMVWAAVGSEMDAAIGGAQTDVLDGGAGDDVLIGGAGIDFLTGGADKDILIGGLALDYLDGGTGDDRLMGGDGADVYNFSGLWGADTIEDSNGDGVLQVAGLGNLDGAGAKKIGEGSGEPTTAKCVTHRSTWARQLHPAMT